MTPWKLPRGRPQGGGRRLAALAAAITTALTLGALLSRYSSATPRRMLLPCCLLNGSAGGGPSWQPPEQRGKERPAVEVVVSHYSASLGWLAAFLSSLPNNTQLTIYSKGPHPPIGAVALPNVGREAHTFAHHFHERYHSLADTTLLLMDSTPGHPHRKLAELAARWRQAQRDGFFCAGLDRRPPPFGFRLDRWLGTTDGSGAGGQSSRARQRSGPALDPASPRPFGAWFAEHIGGPLPRAWCPNAVMAVHRDRARLRPRSFYAALQEQLGVGSNTEAGHFTERSWASIFFVPAAFAGCQS